MRGLLVHESYAALFWKTREAKDSVQTKDKDGTLLQKSQNLHLRGPFGRVLTATRDCTSSGAFKLAGTSALRIISDLAKDRLANKSDKIDLQVGTEENYLSQLLQDHWAFQKRDTIDPVNGRTMYKKEYVALTVTVISETTAARCGRENGNYCGSHASSVLIGPKFR